MAEKIAARYADRLRTADAAQAELAERMEFTRRSVVYLTRLEAWIELMIVGQADGAALQEQLRQLHKYVDYLEASIKTVRAVSDKISTPPEPAPMPARK